MKSKKPKFLLIGVILMAFTFVSCGQSKQDKVNAIIKKFNLVENQKDHYNFQLETLKYQATGNDSVRVLEIEKQLSEEEIIKRISTAFNEIFNDGEINDIYEFIESSAFDKFFNSADTYKTISSKFKDIDSEIESITNNFSGPIQEYIEEPKMKFVPIPVDKENGFYSTVNYHDIKEDKDIELEENPSIDTNDILEVKKVYRSYDNRPEISIVFTKKGARKFYILTKENIGKPVAIVIAKHIVSIPMVNAEIMGGKANVSGDFTEEEIDKMIEILKEK